jgi:hypothetical protein
MVFESRNGSDFFAYALVDKMWAIYQQVLSNFE